MRVRAAIAVVFAAVIGAAMLRQVPDVLDRPLLRDPHGDRLPIPLPGSERDGRVRRTIALHTPDLAGLARFDELRLLVGTYDTSPRLEQGTVSLAGPCVFLAEPQRLSENTIISFRRQGRCDALPSAGGDVAVALTFVASSGRDARAALWMSPAGAEGQALLAGPPGEPRFAPVGRAVRTRGPGGAARVTLLAFLWEVPASMLWAILALASLLLVAGSILVARTTARAAAASSFALAAGLALVYSVVVPPLQAPDEPDHLLGFAQLTARPGLAADASVWAKRIHFHRTTFLGGERFTPADREQPYERDWDPADVFAENVRLRSSTATRLWQALAPVVPSRPPHALLMLRVAEALVFAAAFAAGAALLAGAGASAGAIPALVLLVMPTLPFFGMHLSELTFTLGAFVLIGYTCLLLRQGASGRATGCLLGIATALLAAGPRSGWPALLVIAAAGAARVAGVSAGRPRPIIDAAWFWGGLVVPALVLFGTRLLWIPSPSYEQWHLATFDPRTGISPSAFLLGLAGTAAAGFAAESLSRMAPPVARALGLIARIVCAAGAAGILVTLAWSLVWPLPMLSTVERVAPSSAPEYVRAVLWPLATAARLRQFDFLTWTTLWGGFGWADAILPAAALAIVTAFVMGAAVVTLVGDARNRDGRLALLTVCGLMGIAAGAAAAAYSSYGLHRNMHGRYLLGAGVVGLCVLVAPAVLAPGRRVSTSARATALLALCCGLHAFSLMFLLEKYFG